MAYKHVGALGYRIVATKEPYGSVNTAIGGVVTKTIIIIGWSVDAPVRLQTSRRATQRTRFNKYNCNVVADIGLS